MRAELDRAYHALFLEEHLPVTLRARELTRSFLLACRACWILEYALLCHTFNTKPAILF